MGLLKKQRLIMKALLSVFLSLCVASTCLAQVYVNGIAIDTVNTPFCQLTCSTAGVLTKASVVIDYGQRYVDTGLNRQKIAGADQKPITFNSPIDALNFMIRQGWELVSFKTMGAGADALFIYLLKRKNT
ncbi:hypothetical protein BH09BAC4_BH09BAC4_38610 [soil metagenome]